MSKGFLMACARVALAGFVAACASGPDDNASGETVASVTGTLTMEAPGPAATGSSVLITLDDVSRADAGATRIAETVVDWGGDGTSFSIPYDPASIDDRFSYSVRAEIRGKDDALLWTTTGHNGVVTRGNSTDVELILEKVGSSAAEGRAVPRTLAYRCRGLDFAIRNGPGEVGLFLPDRFVVLPQVQTASGAKYEEEGTVYWSNGDSALLVDGDRRYVNCARHHAAVPWVDARLSGARFRAVGNEPGWSVEIRTDGSFLLSMQYGEVSILVPDAVEAVSGDGREFFGMRDGDSVLVRITAESCQDDMSGEAFDYATVLSVDGAKYRGCGRTLEPAFVGEWKLSGSDISLEADAWGRVRGSTGCNHATGGYRSGLPGELSFGPLATTQRMCDEESMNQEQRFLDLMGRTAHYRLEDGRLVFISEAGQTLLIFEPL